MLSPEVLDPVEVDAAAARVLESLALAELRRRACIAKRKLELMNAAGRLEDLRVPPGNRLEKLRGVLGGFNAIRINDQWRVIFWWADGHAHDVSIVDYH